MGAPAALPRGAFPVIASRNGHLPASLVRHPEWQILLAGHRRLPAEPKRVSGNYPRWSSLGMAYVQQARLTADPTLYGKAEAAFAHA